MKSTAILLVAALAAGAPMDAAAQAKPTAHAQHAQAGAVVPALDIPVEARPAVAVVERFGKALAAGDLKTVEALLREDVLILETGGAENSRAEYLGHHAISDAKFLKGSHHQLKRRTARLSGELAWIGSESELHASKDGKPLTLLSTETMVLRKAGPEWRIAHIHWSSRPKKSN